MIASYLRTIGVDPARDKHFIKWNPLQERKEVTGMDIAVNAEVYCKDGPCGRSSYVIKSRSRGDGFRLGCLDTCVCTFL